jgi:hypothetical protein
VEIDVYKEWLGIPDGPRPPDLYTLLRLVQFEDDVEKIRKNYKKLNGHVRKYATGRYSVISQDLLNEMAKGMLCLTDPERKRDYDEGMGREFPDEDSGPQPMEKILVQQKHITRDQMKEAVGFADQRGLSMRDAVVQMKLTDQEVATQALATELGLPYVDLEDMAPEFTVLSEVPQQLCNRNSILPLFIDDNQLLVACADELTHELEEELRLRLGVPMRRVLATPRSIKNGVSKYYMEFEAAKAAAAEAQAADPKSKKKRTKQESGAPAKPTRKKAKNYFSDLSAEEQQKRKQLGTIAMLWAVIGSVLLDQYFVKPNILEINANLPSLATFIIPPVVIFYVLKVYWK